MGMNDEIKKILRDKTHVELKSADKQAVLENIIGQQLQSKSKFFQNIFLPAGLVASFLVTLIFFQSPPPVDELALMDEQIKTYFEMERALDEISSETVVYTDYQYDLEE
jgi:hypothetical protein